MDTHCIYYLHNGDFIPRYVGKTTKGVQSRYRDHKWQARRGTQRPVYFWMRKYGIDNIQVEVVLSLPEDQSGLLDDYERQYIHIFRERGFADLNMTGGGEGAAGLPVSEATRAKISAANSGRTWTDEQRAAASASRKGRKHSEETKEKMRRSGAGRVFSDEHRKRISEAKSGRPNVVSVAGAKRRADDSRWRAHVRWHVKRNIHNDDCIHCVDSTSKGV